jgi:hypothetical protein
MLVAVGWGPCLGQHLCQMARLPSLPLPRMTPLPKLGAMPWRGGI